MTERNSPLSNQSVAATHETKVVRGPVIPGTWLPACTCGWVGEKEYGRGARDRAREAGYNHALDMEETAAYVAATKSSSSVDVADEEPVGQPQPQSAAPQPIDRRKVADDLYYAALTLRRALTSMHAAPRETYAEAADTVMEAEDTFLGVIDNLIAAAGGEVA